MSEADTSSMPPDDLALQEWIDRQADRFEQAWKQSPRPDIAGFLADSEGRRRWLLLCELLRIDLAHRFRGGESARIEDYLDRFPELASAEAGLPDELVMFAKTLALKHERTDNLREQLANAGSDQERTHFLVCPHCDQPVEIKLSGASGSTVCPKCAGAIEFEFPELAPGAKLRLPRTLGKFQLLEFVGGGSFGTVFKARDSELGRIVAIKFPRSGALENTSDEKRFFKEAQATAALRHPNIVQLHEVGREEGVPYLVSDFVEGKTLADRLEKRTHSQRECLDWICAIADALHFAHTHDVIHRDVKPSNILIDETGHPFITDFGLARRLSDRVQMTIDGQIVGTPAYMSPEQAAGTSSAVDRRSDVFSLGVMLYEMLAGERPFRGNVRMLLQQLIERDPRPLRELNDRIPRDLQTICQKALAKSPGRRYQDAQQFADDLRRFMNREPIHARPVGRFERAWQWCRRNQRLAITYSAATATVLTVTAIAFVLINGARQTAVEQRNKAQTLAGNLADSLNTSEELRQAEAAARKNAERQTRIASSNRLVVQSQAEPSDDASLRLAIEAVETTYGVDGEIVSAAHQNLRDTLGKIHGWPLSPQQPITATAYGPDKLWVATGHEDGSVRIWDLASDDPTASPRTLRGLDGKVSRLAVSPDGHRVVAAGDGGLMAWRNDKGSLAVLGVALGSGSHSFQSLVFGPQSNRIATAGWGDHVHVWNLAAAAPESIVVTIPDKRPEDRTEMEISPDGRWLLTRNTEYVIDGPLATVVRLFDLNAKNDVDKPIQLTEYDDGMREAHFDVSGRWVAALSSEKLWLWDLSAASPKENRRQFWSGEQPLRAIAFDPQGRWLLVSRYAGQSLLLDLSTDDPPKNQWELHLNDEAAVFSPDGKHLACWREAELKLWTLDDVQSAPIDVPCLGVRVKRIGFTHDSQWLACEWADGAIRKVPLTAVDPLAGAEPVSNWDRLAFVARRPRWSVADGDVLRLIDAESPDAVDAIVLRGHEKIPGGGLFGIGPIFEMEVSGDVTTVAIDTHGRRALTAGGDRTVRLWDLASVNPSRTSFFLQDEITQGLAALSADGDWAVTGSPQQNEALLWGFAQGDKPTSIALRGHESVVKHALFTPDSQHAITADRRGVIRSWDCQAAKEAESRVLAQGSDWTHALAIDKRGRRVAAGHRDGTVTVVTLDDRGGAAFAKSFRADEGAIRSVLFDEDGAQLWTGSDDGRLTQWKLSDDGAAERGITLEQSGPIRGIVADPRGAWIATSGLSQTVRWWDLTKVDSGAKPVELFGSSVVVDPTGRWLVCDNQIWDLASPQPFKTPVVLRGHEESITCLTIGAAGRLLATGSKDTTIRIHPFTIDDLLTQARRAAP